MTWRRVIEYFKRTHVLLEGTYNNQMLSRVPEENVWYALAQEVEDTLDEEDSDSVWCSHAVTLPHF